MQWPIRFTAHARRRLAQRKIPEAWVERAIAVPDWVTPEPSDVRLTRAYKHLDANDELAGVEVLGLKDKVGTDDRTSYLHGLVAGLLLRTAAE
jgi:hypothetical protein